MNKIKLKKRSINEALNYYKITDKNYKQNCYDCLNLIIKDKSLKLKLEDLYVSLYNNPTSSLRTTLKQKNTSELFGSVCHPFITNIFLLLGYKVCKKNIIKHRLTYKHIICLRKRIKQALTNDIYVRKLEGIRISQMLWGVFLSNIKIIEIGRLQYEHYKDEKEEYIKIHIPEGEKLIFENVLISLKTSKKFTAKYFNTKCNNFYCSSWLLSKQIKDMVSLNSNIYKFQSLFEIEEGNNCLKDILNFVYKKSECNNFSFLEEKTSLQSKIKNYLIKGSSIKIGIGKLKTDNMN